MKLVLGPEGEFEKKRLLRLVKIQKCDRSFFLLACHGFIESWLREYLHLWEYSTSFEDLIFKFKIMLIEDKKAFPKELSVLQDLRIKERIALAVVHSFVDISHEEASAAAFRLIQFCRLAGVKNEEQIEQISSVLKGWNERKLIEDDELSELRQRLQIAIEKNKNLVAEIEQLRLFRIDYENYNRKIAELEDEIVRLKTGNYGGQAEELVRQVNAARKNRSEANDKITSLNETEAYISDLSRLTSYTRTRLEFERDIIKLSSEQQAVVDSINFKGDFLIKGGAGTGKTLVLIKALEKALELARSELNFNNEGVKVRMLTYNRTLAKYDRYIAELLEQNNSAEISTVDKFLYDKLRIINPEYRIIFDDGYVEEHIPGEMLTETLEKSRAAYELENVIFALNMNMTQYLKQGSGLPEKELEAVWKIRQLVINKMIEGNAFSKNYSRIVLLQYLDTHSEEEIIRDTDFIFIDEIQDLTALDIQAVKACSRRAVVMAGDSDQSIYQENFSFSRAGISIRGNSRILRKNFRNTVEIQDLAEKYRLQTDYADTDNQPEAFRSGPPPELYCSEGIDEVHSMITARVRLFIEILKYDPENICILVPGSRDIEPLKERLASMGYSACDLRTDEFSFSQRDVIRISTMHSSKGLDFPVVLLSLHNLPQTSASGKTSREKIIRNLIYVSMTRAMDHLNIFTLKNNEGPEISGLAGLF